MGSAESLYRKASGACLDRAVDPFVGGKGFPVAGLTAAFCKAVLKQKAEWTRSEREWAVLYIDAFRALQQQCQKHGYYEGWEQAGREQARFEAEGDISEEAVVETPRELQAVQQKYRRLRLKRAAEHHRTILHLTQRHVQELENLQRTLTKQNRMNEGGAG